MSTDAIGNTSTSSQTNANAMFGECLGLAYYCGPVEEWMVATNGLLIAINVVSALITLSANTLFLIVYFKTKALMSTHYFFLMLLAVTDVSVGMISQPLLIARKLMEISGVYNCALWTAMRSTVYYFSGISFLTLTLVTIERYLAVCRPIKHRNEMTRGRMARIAFAVWLAWLLFPIFRFVFLEFYKVFLLLIGGIIVAIFAINAFLYAKIRRTVLGKDPSDDVALRKVQREADLKKEARLAKTIACLMLVMILAYLPTVMGLGYKAVAGVDTAYLFGYLPFADTFILLNSSFNPFFYCYWNASIREAIYNCFSGSRKPRVPPGSCTNSVECIDDANV